MSKGPRSRFCLSFINRHWHMLKQIAIKDVCKSIVFWNEHELILFSLVRLQAFVLFPFQTHLVSYHQYLQEEQSALPNLSNFGYFSGILQWYKAAIDPPQGLIPRLV